MSASKYQPPTWRLELLITVLGISGMILFVVFYDQAFPSAAIDLTLSRAEIADEAGAYLASQGHDVQDYEFALSFDEDGWASVYLQQILGVAEANRLIRAEDLPIWYWRARWFRPLQKEEFSVYLATDGQVVAFFHSIAEEDPGAALPEDQARSLAEGYLVHDRRWALEDWEPVTASTSEKPGGRIDHSFEWKRRDWAVGEGDLRLYVRVQGDQVGGYDYWLRVPEAFQRASREQSNLAGFWGGLSYELGFYGFLLAAVVAYGLALWRGRLSWRVGLVPALAVATVGLLAGLNYLPLHKAGYDTTQDYTLFWLENLLGLLASAAYSGAIVLVLWAGGQALSKVTWPRQDRILPRGEDRWGDLSRSSWRGLMLGGLMGGYVVVFYLAATRLFGSWTPLDVSNPALLATPLPFLGPLRSGFLPAMEEELLFRMVGISLLLRLTRRRWLALLVPGALWAFAHLGYARDPFYLRGIELTLVAVFLLGLFFLRFGLATVIVAHMAYNAGLGAFPLLRSGDPYFLVAGLIVVAVLLAPVVPGLVRGLRRRLEGDRERAPALEVARAGPGDLAGLAALPVADVDWPALLGDPSAVVICLRAAERVVGVAVGRVDAGGAGRMPVVYVAPAWRRQYGGSCLVDALSEAFQQQGVQAVVVQVETRDRRTTAFWTSQGWRATARVLSRSLVSLPGPSWRERATGLWVAVKGAIWPISD